MAKISIRINTEKETIPELEKEIEILEVNTKVLKGIINMKRLMSLF